MIKVFVYGTLKVGGHFATQFDDSRISVIRARVTGKLYNTGYNYPAAVFNSTIDNIYGEVHKYPSSILSQLDAIEGYCGEGKNNLYNRIVIPVHIKDTNEIIDVFSYEYAGNIASMGRITSGIWEI